MFRAIRAGASSIVKKELERGINPNKSDNYGVLPLHLAVEKGHEDIIRWLVAHDADINKEDKHGRLPIEIAYHRKNFECMHLLFELGTKVGYRRKKAPYLFETLLCSQNREMLECYLKCGMNINEKDRWGDPVFFHCFESSMINTEEALRFLLKHGLDINATNNFGSNAMQLFRHNIIWKTVNPVSLGIDINNRNKYGYTVLHYPISLETTKQLVHDGIDIHAISNVGESVMHMLAKKDNTEHISYFHSLGIDINQTDSNGRTPFHEAIICREWNNALMFITLGADIRCGQFVTHGGNILSTVVEYQQSEIAKHVIMHCDNINQLDTRGGHLITNVFYDHMPTFRNLWFAGARDCVSQWYFVGCVLSTHKYTRTMVEIDLLRRNESLQLRCFRLARTFMTLSEIRIFIPSYVIHSISNHCVK